MKTKIFSLVCAFLGLSLSLRAQGALSVKVLTLSNGFTVWLNEDHSQPKVFGAVVVRAGAKDCPNTGIAHYFEHLLFKGTTRIGTVDYGAERPWLDSISAQYDSLAHTRDAARRLSIQRHINHLSIRAAQYAIPNEFENLISAYGGTGLNAYTSFDETVFHNSFSPQFLPQWCELYAERFLSPVFRLFQSELETVYEEKNMYADMMIVPPAEHVQRIALAGTPYAYPILGSTDNLKNPRLSEMRRFFHHYYVAGNMGLVLCGDVRADNLQPLLERTFGRLPAGEVPPRERSEKPDWKHLGTVSLKLPVPLVKASAFGFEAPRESHADRPAFDVMLYLLQNKQGTGLLDSLNNTGRLFRAMAMEYDFKDFSLFGFGAVPNIPFGTKRAAERLLWQQVNRLRKGDISRDRLEAAKTALVRAQELSLEDISHRSAALVNAFSHDLPWQQVISYPQRIKAVTLQDVARVACTYFNDDSLRVKKTLGRYPKEHVAQPGYKAVNPPHAGGHSAYADSLAHATKVSAMPRLVDFDHDVRSMRLRPGVSLYTVSNPVNDIFRLQLIYRRGTLAEPRLRALAAYLNTLGTLQHSRQQFALALQRLGASLQVSAGLNQFVVTLSGFDAQMEPALKLLREFLLQPQNDASKYLRMLRRSRLARTMEAKDNSNVASMLLQRVAYGDSSEYLFRPTIKELKRLDPQRLLDLFADVQARQLDLVYSGTLVDTVLTPLLRRYLPVERVCLPADQRCRSLQSSDAPVVYVVNVPKARQTLVQTYQRLAPTPDDRQRSTLALWGSYFGGGMSSVLFQDIREFRSFAYSAHGRVLSLDLGRHPQQCRAYVTRLGTQADKTLLALAVLDSLQQDMPLRPTNLDAARQNLFNQINNGFPSFRDLGAFVAGRRAEGYAADPDSMLLRQLPTLTMDDVASFFTDKVKPASRVVMVVGSRKQIDLKALRHYGRVVELSLSDLCEF